ncbi:ParB/RepB/Spo0J family partition protein [uncultured Oscillibacter sp.]|uniref:ParB/RepB/Spo0J family partition protein n=1 Tax=uncultured Oscillibacter sp. TaxID=876091 RepID=UPI0025FC6F9D|nr:ParB/RepB/Spo0J family partition protein [uncultured Oscillibacter sp.]
MENNGDVLDRLFSGALDVSGTAERTQPPAAPLSGLQELPIELLDDFSTGMNRQPFHPYSQEDMEALRRDIVANGVIQPLIVRPRGEHRYEIISGHNRRTAARAAGYTVVPCLVRQLGDDEAIVQMISTNLRQRKDLLPSEKAFAYRFQLEAMKRQGKRTDLTSAQVGPRLSTEIIGEASGDSRNQVKRYIRLTCLIPSLLKLVDEKKMGLTVGVTLSFLCREAQAAVETYCFQEHSVYICQDLADRLREADGSGKRLTPELLDELVRPSGKNLRKVTLPLKTVQRYFPEGVTQEEVERTVQQALKLYFAGKR